MRTAHRYTVRLVALGVVVQFFLAGAGAFGAISFDAHEALGTVLLVLSGVALVLSLLAHAFRRYTALLVGTLLLQAVLGILGADTQAWIGGLHAVNAIAVMGVAGTLAGRTSERGRPPWARAAAQDL
jgi:hypothetical protein